jgi:hypothetical protein
MPARNKSLRCQPQRSPSPLPCPRPSLPSQFPISTIRAPAASREPRSAKKLAHFHFLAFFAGKSNNTHTFHFPPLGTLHQTQGILQYFSPPLPKTRILTSDSIIFAPSSLTASPRAFHPAHGGVEAGGARKEQWGRNVRRRATRARDARDCWRGLRVGVGWLARFTGETMHATCP